MCFSGYVQSESRATINLQDEDEDDIDLDLEGVNIDENIDTTVCYKLSSTERIKRLFVSGHQH